MERYSDKNSSNDLENAVIEIDRLHGTGKEKIIFPKEKNPPTIFGEEIDNDPPCCVWNLSATLRPFAPGETGRLNGQGPVYVVGFGRTIDFEIEMKNAAYANKIKVIQYWKDERYTVRNGANVVRLSQHVAPDPDPGWQWVPGADGWTVDSEDTNRCWLEAAMTRAGNKVTWHDTVTLSSTALQRLLNANSPGFKPDDVANGGDFPHEITTLYKTDIFCSDRDVCDETVAQNQENPIASVTWRQKFTIRTIRVNNPRFPLGWAIAGLANEVLIDNINTSVYHWCPSSPHKTI